MNCVRFDPTNLLDEKREWWEKWCSKAEKAAAEAIRQSENGEEVKFDSKIWSELKRWLLENVFMGKCAYCESKVTVTEYGDADHYRPKASVHGIPDHHGYYWVAYDWRNLVPSCKRCNTGGKRDHFPIAGKRVFSRKKADCTSSLDAIEMPLLLHPYNYGEDHPRKHLVFNKLGHVKSRNGSEKGRWSIEVYGLRRKELRNARRESQNHAWLQYEKLMDAPKSKRLAFLKRFCDGGEKHSCAILDYILQRLDELKADIALIVMLQGIVYIESKRIFVAAKR